MRAVPEPREELLVRARHTRVELERWLKDERFQERTRLSTPQAEVLRAAFQGLLQAQVAQEERLRTASEELRTTAYRDLEQALSKLERARQLLRAIPDQRGDTSLLAVLQTADRLTQEGYSTGLGGVVPAGASPAPPIVVLEPGEGPAMTPPVSDVFATGFTGANQKLQVTIPFVYVPISYLSALWTFTTLQHEVGHHLDVVLKLRQAASTRLPTVLPGEDWDTDTRRKHWTRWLPEVIADAWGVVLSGEAYALMLAQILAGRGRSRWSLANPSYPPLALRLALLCELLRQLAQASGHPGLFADTLESLEALEIARPLEAAPDAWEAYRRDAERIAALLLSLEVGPSTGRTLGRVVDIHQETVLTRQVARALREERWSASTAPGAPLRALPSAAMLAMMAEPTRAAELHARAVEVLSKLPAPEWVVPPERLRFFQDVEYLRPTILQPDGDTWKSPPVRLLLQYDTVAFVGATHHQLLASLREAGAQRSSRPWKRLEFFFLTEERLCWLARDEQQLEHLRDLRRAALEALGEYLANEHPGGVLEWVFYEYDRPHYFASYWDWDEPEGRIHISPYVWGQDVGRCPGMDRVRGTTPLDEFQFYIDGLEALRHPSSGTTVLRRGGSGSL